MQKSLPNRKKHSLVASLPVAALAVTSLVALWQRHRTRRSIRELHPPESVALPTSVPHVSIILPVRNEAAHIDTCLASLLAQDYPDFSILVIDDGSTDSTPQLLAAWSARDPRVRVQRVDQLPADWAGKTYALHLGVLLTRGEWLLFTDADTCHEPQTLRLMMGYALRQQDDLLSISMNVMTLSGSATPLLMPVTEILLALRWTPATILDPTSRRAFAFGQYMLLRREAYVQTEGYNAPGMRASAVEDLALAEQIKRSGRRVELVDGSGLIQNRQWTTWKSARQGWGKGCYSEIVQWPVPLAGFLFALALIAYGLGPAGTVIYLIGRGKARRVSFWLAALTALVQIDTKRRIDRKYGLRGPWALTAPIAWTVCGAITLDVTRQIQAGQRTVWKGRRVPEPEYSQAPQTNPFLFESLYERRVSPDCLSATGEDGV